MLSLIERGESSPTAALLERLAVGLNVPLATMFGGVVEGDAPEGPVQRRAARSEWRDPETGYVRSNLSPPQVPQPLQLAEVELPVKARVVFESPVRDVKVYQQIVVLEGTIEVTCANQCHRLAVGDCLAMQVEGTSIFENPSRQTARYLVASATEVNSRRRA